MSCDAVSVLEKLDVSSRDLLYIDNKEVKVWKASEHTGFSGFIERLCRSIQGQFDLNIVASALEEKLVNYEESTKEDVRNKVKPNREVFGKLEALKNRISIKNSSDPRISRISSLQRKFCLNQRTFETAFYLTKREMPSGSVFLLEEGDILADYGTLLFSDREEIKKHFVKRNDSAVNTRIKGLEQELCGKLEEFKLGNDFDFVKDYRDRLIDSYLSDIGGRISTVHANVDSVFEGIKREVKEKCVEKIIDDLFDKPLKELEAKYGQKISETRLAALKSEFSDLIRNDVNVCGELKGRLEEVLGKEFHPIKLLDELFGTKLAVLKAKYGEDLIPKEDLDVLRGEYFQRLKDNVNEYGNLEGELEAVFKKRFLEKICDDKAEAFRKKNGSDSKNNLNLNIIKKHFIKSLLFVSGDIQMDEIALKWDGIAKRLVKKRNSSILTQEYSGPEFPSKYLNIDNMDKFKEAVGKVKLRILNNEEVLKKELEFYQKEYPTLNLQENFPSDYFLLSSKKRTKSSSRSPNLQGNDLLQSASFQPSPKKEKKSSSDFTIAVKKWVDGKVIDSNKKAWDEICDAHPELNLKVLNLPESIYKLSGADFISEVKKLILKDVLMPKYAQEYPEVQFKIDDLPPEFFDIPNIKDFEAAIEGWVKNRSDNLMILQFFRAKYQPKINAQLSAFDAPRVFDLAVKEMAKRGKLDLAKVLKGEIPLMVSSALAEECISHAVKQVAG